MDDYNEGINFIEQIRWENGGSIVEGAEWFAVVLGRNAT